MIVDVSVSLTLVEAEETVESFIGGDVVLTVVVSTAVGLEE